MEVLIIKCFAVSVFLPLFINLTPADRALLVSQEAKLYRPAVSVRQWQKKVKGEVEKTITFVLYIILE